MTATVDAVRALADLPEVGESVDRAREACTELRWHNALRRRIPQAAAESRVRGARASAALDGAEVSVDVVRELVVGLTSWPEEPDPLERALRGSADPSAAGLGALLRSLWPVLRDTPILRRRAAMTEAMTRLAGWRLKGCGAYFAWAEHPFAESSADLAPRLVREAGVLLLPGTMFMPAGDPAGPQGPRRRPRARRPGHSRDPSG